MGEVAECRNFTECSAVDDVARVCFKRDINSNKTNFCGCSDFLGFTGEKCDERTGTTRYALFSGSTFVIWSIFLVYVSIRMMYTQYSLFMDDNSSPTVSVNLSAVAQENRGKRLMRSITVVVFLSSLSMLIGTSFNIVNLLNPQEFEVLVEAGIFFSIELVTSQNERFTTHLTVLGKVFQVLALLLVLLSWINVLEGVDNMFPQLNNVITASTLRKIIFIVFPVAILLVLIFPVVGYLYGSLLILLIVCLFEVILFFIVDRKFICKLSHFSGSDDKFTKVSKLIKRSSRYFIANLTAIILLVVTSLVGNALFIDIVDFDGFNYILILRDASIWVTFLGLTYLSWYTHIITSNLYNNKSGWVYSKRNSSIVTEKKNSIITSNGLPRVVVENKSIA